MISLFIFKNVDRHVRPSASPSAPSARGGPAAAAATAVAAAMSPVVASARLTGMRAIRAPWDVAASSGRPSSAPPGRMAPLLPLLLFGLVAVQPLGNRLRSNDPPFSDSLPLLLLWRWVVVHCDVREDVVHHGGQPLSQHPIARGSGMDQVLPPQLQDGVDVNIVVVEAEGVGGVEGLDVLDPPQKDHAVDPAVDILYPLDQTVDVAVSVPIGYMARVSTAFGNQVTRHWPHYDHLQSSCSLDEGENEDEKLFHILLADHFQLSLHVVFPVTTLTGEGFLPLRSARVINRIVKRLKQNHRFFRIEAFYSLFEIRGQEAMLATDSSEILNPGTLTSTTLR